MTSDQRSPTMSSVVAIGQPERDLRSCGRVTPKEWGGHLRNANHQVSITCILRVTGVGAMFTGGCLCGAVRYECTGEAAMAGHCHCLDCRRTSGSGHSSHLATPSATVTITGQVAEYAAPADSGNVVTRAFCPVCGAPVYSTNAGMPGLTFLRASSLDDPEVFQPQMVVYASRAPSWDHMDGSLPSFAIMPPMPHSA